MRFIFAFLIVLIPLFSFAGYEVTLLRRAVVFPVAEIAQNQQEDAWWQMREALTKDQKLLVASRRFMINRGVFQPRKNLKPADVIILGKILDAQILITSFLEDRVLKMYAYEAESGYTLWAQEVNLHPVIPIQDQIVKASKNLIVGFMAAFPYQGFVLTNDKLSQTTFEKDGQHFAWVFAGTANQIQNGDLGQWVQVTTDSKDAVLNDSMKVTVVAEGEVVDIKDQMFLLKINKMTKVSDFQEGSLVRFPKEIARLRDLLQNEDKISSLGNEVLSSGMRDAADLQKGHQKTAVTMAFIFNIAAFILMAF